MDSSSRISSFLKDYYILGSEYDIDLSKTEKVITDSVKGKVTEIRAKEEDNSLVLQARYITQSEQETFQEIARVYFLSNELKKFFYYSMKSYLMKNYKRRNWGKGPVWETVLDALKVPKFVTNRKLNKNRIKRLMSEFFKSSPIRDANLSDLETKFQLAERIIDDKVFELYGLTTEEVTWVNSFVEQQKKYVSRTI